MFSQKKRTPWGWIAVILVLAALGLMLIFAALTDDTDLDEGDKKGVIKSEESDTPDNGSDMDDDYSDGSGAEHTSNIVAESYYLVKNDNNEVRVFFFDSRGKSIELEKTNIVYETLSESDQRRLDVGIKLYNRDELNKLIMDYES